MMTPEGWEKKDLDAFLDEIGAYVVKPATGGYGASGHADRICCIQGMFFSCEVKREGKEPTVLQARRMEEVEKAGGFAVAGTAAVIIAFIKTALAE
jgi:Holliday junction resolvase